MTYYAFSGTFTTGDTSPDGDTIRFRPDHRRHLAALVGSQRPEWSKQHTVQVRLEGIDAPELHYEGARQRRSAAARTRLLQLLGFPRVELFADWVQPRSEARGSIVAQSVDMHGRVIGFAYRRSAADGPIPLDRWLVGASANAAMLAAGAAYPLTYASLEPGVRQQLQSIAQWARDARRGVWFGDATRRFTLRGIGSVGARGALVFPKLFRRCVAFCNEDAGQGARAFVAWLRGTPEHDDFVWVGRRRARLSSLLTAGRHVVRLAVDPMSIVFEPR
jgi:endonuclease YncB( thermonuclease family)